MNITTRDRSALKSYFVSNSIPTEENFQDLIDGMLNLKDDGLVKNPGDPLGIEAAGNVASQKKFLNLYNSFSDPNPDWILSLNPRTDPGDGNSEKKSGFSINDGTSNASRLFIEKATGKVGIGTVTPRKQLHVRADAADAAAIIENAATNGAGLIVSADSDPLRLGGKGDETGQHLIVKGNGRVGIGTTTPQDKLEVKGNARVEILRASQGFILPPKTDGFRAGAGDIGALRYNKASGAIEVWEGNQWIRVSGPLYDFSSHTFTPCGSTGRVGPTLAQCRAAYAAMGWAQRNEFFTVQGGIQQWKAPETGNYRMEAWGAAGGAIHPGCGGPWRENDGDLFPR
uniref:Uncharacterized protein n=1 Tax=Candidatus Kentrum sp. LPFa TaxID=2126335 RepID=A0A450VVC1_9GAMM|nr:MAG: hypothetical protein BECKLPF1236B_GA0070989_100411 [Candidatus Kentron sp. LPFa]